jgi:hypothetical protein
MLNKDVRYLSSLDSLVTNIGVGEKGNGESSPDNLKAFSFVSAFGEDLWPIQLCIQCT